MKNRIIIPGPPGTGKTYRLMQYIKKEVEEYKTPQDKILYISFSKAAEREARKRIAYPKIRVSTLHALGAQELGLDVKKQLLQGKEWKKFKNANPICQGLSFETFVDDTGLPRYKNVHMQLIEYSRAKKINLIQAATELNITADLNYTQIIQDQVEQYKKDTKMIEFHDMINDFIRKDLCPPVEAVFLDEAQDLSPLQWDVFFYIEGRSRRSYIAGDDDQAIYNFQGASSEIFINLEGTFDAQIKSQRVPRKVFEYAKKILPNITERLEKEWKPKDEEGEVFENVYLQDIDFSTGNWMIIARTNKMLQPIAEEIYNQGYRFEAKHNEILPPEPLNAYRIWQRLNQGAYIDKYDAKDLYSCLSYKLGHVEYGFSSGKSLDNIDSVDIDTLRMEHGLRVTGSWEQFNISQHIKDYMNVLLNSGDDLMSKPRIKISTIHRVKGEEADNVVLFLDLNRVIYKASQFNADPEHRTFFVGVTRAKHNLFLMQPTSEYQYNIGGPI